MNKVGTAQVKRLQWTDTTNPLFRLRYKGNESTHTAKIEILNIFGGTADIFGLTLTDGSTTYGFSGATATSSTNDTDVVTATLTAMVNAVNDLDNWECSRVNGPADYSLNSNDFTALAATQITREWYSTGYRDISEVLHASIRIGNPEVDKRGRIALGRIRGAATYASGAVTLYVSEDRGKAASDENLLFQETAAATTTVSSPVDFTTVGGPESWPVFNGPLLIEVKGSAALATGTRYDVLYAPVFD